MAQVIEQPETEIAEPTIDIENRSLRGKRARAARQERARLRLLQSSTRTARQQIARLNKVCGMNKGAKRERARLQEQISADKHK